MQRDNFTCQHCGNGLNDGVPLNVHHIRYRRNLMPWEYDDADLTTLCEKCHKEEHSGKTKITSNLYKVGKGKLSFNENNTFALELYGRNMLGHKFWPHRRMDLNVKGLYTAKNDSIYFYVNPDDIKCHVVGGREDPAMSPNYDPSNQRTTWNGSEVRYDSELRI